jgi:hypothetical protein
MVVAHNGIGIWSSGLVTDRRHDKRHVDEELAPEQFRICVRDLVTGLALEIYLALIADPGYKGTQKYWESIIIKPTRLDVPGAAQRAIEIDSDRAPVECFFGRLKRRFPILGDEGFRLDRTKLELVVRLCIALTNQRQRAKGYALRTPPRGFVRCVPYPMTPSEIADAGGVIPAPRPPVHPPDRLSGLRPDNARELAADPARQWPRRSPSTQ